LALKTSIAWASLNQTVFYGIKLGRSIEARMASADLASGSDRPPLRAPGQLGHKIV